MTNTLSTEEKDQLVTFFESLDVKPKVDNLHQWISEYVKSNQDGADEATIQPRHNMDEKPVSSVYAPKLQIFTGAEDKKDTPYEAWKYEVQTLVKEGVYSTHVIATSAKKSLRGEAAKIARRLGCDATLDDLIKKFDGIYGTVEDSNVLLSQFYNATQLPDETVSAWGCRLEDLLDRALTSGLSMPGPSLNNMLRDQFWGGLHHHLKEPMRHQMSKITDFDEFRIETRKIEREKSKLPKDDPTMNVKKPAQVKMITADDTKRSLDLDELKGMVCQINSRLSNLESGLKNNTSSHPEKTNLPRRKWNRRSQSRGRPRGGYRDYHNWHSDKSNKTEHHSSQQSGGSQSIRQTDPVLPLSPNWTCCNWMQS
jgi:hypothetical protein